MHSDIDKFFSVMAGMFHGIHESLGSTAAIVFGVLLFAAAVAALLTWFWILSGGLSRWHHQFLAKQFIADSHFKGRNNGE